MTDLPDRILAAIAETAALANAAASDDTSEWRQGTHDIGWDEVADTEDPRATLRRCEADKRTVERHSHVGHSVPFGDYELAYCRACGNLIPCPDLLDRASAYDIEAP